jgi:hypothetical protein
LRTTLLLLLHQVLLGVHLLLHTLLWQLWGLQLLPRPHLPLPLLLGWDLLLLQLMLHLLRRVLLLGSLVFDQLGWVELLRLALYLLLLLLLLLLLYGCGCCVLLLLCGCCRLLLLLCSYGCCRYLLLCGCRCCRCLLLCGSRC